MSSSDWVIRKSVSEDESCLVSMWLQGYAYAAEVRGHYKSIIDDIKHKRTRDVERSDYIRYWKVYQPIITGLVRNADVTVLCDPDRYDYKSGEPAIIWGWLCTSGPSIVHWVSVKRQADRAGLSKEILQELLGDRLRLRQRHTFELCEPHDVTSGPPRIWKDLRSLGAFDGPAAQVAAAGGQNLWERDRGWLQAMRTLSLRTLMKDKLTEAVGGHILDTRREQWRVGSTDWAA